MTFNLKHDYIFRIIVFDDALFFFLTGTGLEQVEIVGPDLD